MTPHPNTRLLLLGPLAVLLALLGAGCGYELRIVSESPALEKAPPARERLPLRAVCEWRADRKFDSLALYEVQGYPIAYWERNPSGPPVDALRAGLMEVGLFDGVARLAEEVHQAQEGELLISVSEKVVSVPELWETWRYIGAVPPFWLILAIWTERSPALVVDFEMRCLDPRGEVLARYTAQCTIVVDMQHPGGWVHEGRIEAEDMARAYAAKVLLGKVAADEALPAEVRQRLSKQPAVSVAAPPAPPPIDSPSETSSPARPEASGAVFVLVVGINAYADAKIPSLRFAEPDAREVYAFFATERRSPTDPDRVQLVTGKAATRRGVREAIREHLVKKAVRPEDTAILYFAGHGFRDAEDTYLACQDASIDGLADTAISAEELRSLWSKIGAARKVLLVDACQSAAVGSVRGIGGVSLAPEGAPTTSGGGTLAIAATGPNELSTEDETLGHGVFTIGLLKGLRGEADADKDGRVTGAELGAFVQVEVPRLAVRAGGRQTPAVTGAQGPRVILSR